MKTISVVVPCYNEEENVDAMAAAIREEFEQHLPSYGYEIIFIDNHSKDSTRDHIRILAASDPHVKAIFNVKNFGQFNSPYYGLTQARGDAAVLMACDFQEPVELIR
ncbi:MAG: glycosyltransferase, partial [Clostridia bacterium]|nr:glycosyltransferase [Clostridia bacterium]